MTIDHKDFTNPARVHEPKQMLSSTIADTGKVITPSSVDNGVGVLRKLTLSEVDTTVETPWTGWEHSVDSTYTSGSPLSITGGTRTKVTIDGAGTASENSYLPEEASALWNVGNNTFDPVYVGDCYDVRLQFKCSTTNSGDYVDCDLDIGGSLGVILAETRPILKASDATNTVVFSWPVFTMDTFLANSGEFYITPSANTDFWDFAITIIKTHNGGA